MSEVEAQDPNDEEVRPKKPMTRYEEKGAADLERVTDFVEEQELAGIGEAIKAVNAAESEEASAREQKERQLSKIKVNAEDVQLIMNEMEVPRLVAERKLREYHGDVVQALVEMTN